MRCLFISVRNPGEHARLFDVYQSQVATGAPEHIKYYKLVCSALSQQLHLRRDSRVEVRLPFHDSLSSQRAG